MVKPEEPALRIALGLAGRLPDGGYDLGEVPAAVVAAEPALVHEEGFEAGVGGWTATAGMSASRAGEAHSGEGCLLLAGSQPGGAWNYASAALRQPILPLSRYRLSVWMRVDETDAPQHPPYVKLGLHAPDGKWLANAATNRYDLGRRGAWQRLEGYIETTADTASGQLAVEKGALEIKVSASIRLDDIKLELVESP
jgi:hypothetical protein